MSVDITTIGYEIDTRQVKSASRDLDNLEKSSRKAAGGADATNTAFAGLSRTALGLVSALGVAGIGRVLIQQVDQYTKYTAQIKLATRSTQEYTSALADVRRIAATAQSDLSSVGTLYARLSNSLRDLGATQQDTARVTEVVGLGLKVSGASAIESASAMLQLSQAFNSGRLAGQEFTALAENAPALLRALAESMGVPIGSLKQLAADGAITSDVLLKAFGDQKLLDTFRNQAKEVNTISGAFQVLKNNVLETIGQLNAATGAGSNFANVILSLANSRALRIPFETIAVLGANIAYVFKQVGNEIGGIAAQISRLLSGDFKGAMAIREQMLKDAKVARAEIDKTTAAMLNPEVSQGALVTATGTVAKNAASAAADTDKAAKKTSELMKWYEAENKRIQDAIGERARENEKDRMEFFEELAKSQKDELEQRMKDEEEFKKRQLKVAQDVSDARVRAYREGQEIIQRENDRTSESLSRSITDGIFRGFENGKGFFRNFIDVLINGLKTAFVQPFVTNIIKASGIGSLFSSAGAFASAGSSGLVASGAGGGFSIGNVLSGLKTSFDAFSGNLVGGVEKLGALIANGQGGIADAIGGFMGQYAGPITSALAFAPAVFSLLKGDTKGALLSGGGAALGSLFGPGGAVIGGAIGSLLGGAFGSKKKNPRIGAAVTGTYSTATDKYLQTAVGKGGAKKFDPANATAIGTVNQALLSQLGGFLDEMGIAANLSAQSGFYTKAGKKSIGQFSGAINGKGFGFTEVYGKDDDQAFQKYIDSALGIVMVQAIKASPLSTALKQLFTRSTDKAVVLGMMNAVVALNKEQSQLNEKYSITVDQAAQVATATGLAGQAQVDFVKKLSAAVQTTGSVLIQARESLLGSLGSNGVNSLPNTLKGFDDILKGIDKTTSAGIKSFMELFSLREQFAAFTQSIDQLKGGVNSTLMPFLSAQEQQAIKQAELAKVFDSLNMSVPGSLQELIELGKGIDYTTKEGLDLAAVFPQLVQAFQDAKGATDGLIDSLTQLDSNKYKTLVDFTRAQRYQANGIPLSMLPSYDVGTAYVPQTGPAMIHQGERILTAAENRAYSGGSEISAALLSEIRLLRADLRAGQVSAVIAAQKSAKILEKFDRQGILLAELDNEGNPYVVPVSVEGVANVLVTNTGAAEAVPVDTTP
jgi:tape measure domain-containing protein